MPRARWPSGGRARTRAGETFGQFSRLAAGGPWSFGPAARPPRRAVMSPKLARPIALCAALTIPALFMRLSGVHPAAALGLLVFGTAVVAASFLLAWAAEAARVDISGPFVQSQPRNCAGGLYLVTEIAASGVAAGRSEQAVSALPQSSVFGAMRATCQGAGSRCSTKARMCTRAGRRRRRARPRQLAAPSRAGGGSARAGP